MKFDFEIPPELAHLRIDERGYPIPYFARMIDGKPNFRFLDKFKYEQCIAKKLCGICGKKHRTGVSTYQITGPGGLKNKISSEAMMHLVCAEFSLRVCPHLHYEKAERKESTANDPGLSPDKPPEIYLVKASKWEARHNKIFTQSPVNDTQTRVLLIHYTPISAQKYIYLDGLLTRDESGDLSFK